MALDSQSSDSIVICGTASDGFRLHKCVALKYQDSYELLVIRTASCSNTLINRHVRKTAQRRKRFLKNRTVRNVEFHPD